MRKLLLLAAAAALVAPANALAKEVTKLDVCGASGCNSTTDRELLLQIGGGSNGESTIAVPDLQSYYRLVYTVDEGTKTFQFTNFYIPGVKATRGVDQNGYTHFYPVTAEFADAVEALARGLQPFPKPQLLRVTIGRKVAADPASYERLLTLKARERYTATTDWRRIKFATGVQSPWSRDGTILEFAPRGGYLYRDSHTMKLPKGLAARIKAGKSLDSTNGVGRMAISGAAFGLLAVAVATGVVFRRRRSN